MEKKLKEFTEKARRASNSALLDSLVEHARHKDLDHEILKILKKEILDRIQKNN